MSLSAQPRSILILDDAPAVAESLALVLSRNGFGVKVAHSAEEALEMTANWEPDAAFVDIMLPGMNGIEFSEILRSRYPQCGVELMSGHPATEDLMESARREGREIAVLPKPFDPAQFLAIARGGKTAAYENEKSIESLAIPLEPQLPAVGAEPLPRIAETQPRAIRKPKDPGPQA